MRRDKIIKDMVLTIPYKEGDWCSPVTEADREKYGMVIHVSYIADNYVKYGKHNKWPADDKPLIVSAWSGKLKENFICTPDFLEKSDA